MEPSTFVTTPDNTRLFCNRPHHPIFLAWTCNTVLGDIHGISGSCPAFPFPSPSGVVSLTLKSQSGATLIIFFCKQSASAALSFQKLGGSLSLTGFHLQCTHYGNYQIGQFWPLYIVEWRESLFPAPALGSGLIVVVSLSVQSRPFDAIMPVLHTFPCKWHCGLDDWFLTGFIWFYSPKVLGD